VIYCGKISASVWIVILNERLERISVFLLFSDAKKVSKNALRHSKVACKKWLYLCFKVKSGRSGSETQALLTKHNETAIFLFFASLREMTLFPQ